MTAASAALQIIARDRPRKRRPLPLAGELGLARGRVHEVCGPARRLFALIAAQGTEGPVIWIAPAWQAERLNPQGVAPLIAPGRLVLVLPRREDQILWCMEEALRSGASPLVVAELTALPGLTPVRRLHLAAEAGAEERRAVPTGLLLTPGEGGAAGVESRWRLAPRDGGGAESWRLELLRARAAPPQGRELRREAGRFGLAPLRGAAGIAGR